MCSLAGSYFVHGLHFLRAAHRAAGLSAPAVSPGRHPLVTCCCHQCCSLLLPRAAALPHACPLPPTRPPAATVAARSPLGHCAAGCMRPRRRCRRCDPSYDAFTCQQRMQPQRMQPLHSGRLSIPLPFPRPSLLHRSASASTRANPTSGILAATNTQRAQHGRVLCNPLG